MAPIPATTAILYVTYEGNFGRRTVQCRWLGTFPSGDAATQFRTFLLNGIAPLWSTTTQVTSWAWRNEGATFSLPIASPGAVVGTNGGSVTAVDYPRFLTITGRGLTDGRETRMSLYGGVFSQQNDYRFTGVESAGVAAIWNAASLLATGGGFRTAGGSATSVRLYANSGQNAYYQRKARVSS